MVALLRVLLSLAPLVMRMIDDEKAQGTGRNQIVKAVRKKFNVVEGRAVAARNRAANRLDSDGVRSNRRFARK